MNCGKKINAKYEFSFLNYDFHLKKQVLPSEQIPPKIHSLSLPPRPLKNTTLKHCIKETVFLLQSKF